MEYGIAVMVVAALRPSWLLTLTNGLAMVGIGIIGTWQ